MQIYLESLAIADDMVIYGTYTEEHDRFPQVPESHKKIQPPSEQGQASILHGNC